MTFQELAVLRYSVRSFLSTPVEEDSLSYILECGRIAPSAANFQPSYVIVVRAMEVKKALYSTYPRDWFRQAPVILVCCGDRSRGWKRSDGKDHTDIDVSIMVDHITLAAAEKGLGTCWICNFDATACREILRLPGHIEPVVYLPLGYPADQPDPNSRHKIRRALEEVVRYDHF